MISIDEAFIEAAAPNSEAAKNGRGLVLKGKYVRLYQSADGSLIFGHCQRSGKQPYLCSADFAVPLAPVYRCTCPSRQFPCKHSLGLLYALADGKKFTASDVPAELEAKREKAAVRVEKRKAEADKPHKVNTAA